VIETLKAVVAGRIDLIGSGEITDLTQEVEKAVGG
jgi:hypothetical protein